MLLLKNRRFKLSCIIGNIRIYNTMHSKEFLALIFKHSQSKYYTYFFFRNTYRHIDALSSFVYIQHCRFHYVCHKSLLHTQDYMHYHTCLHTILVYIHAYNYHLLYHKRHLNSVMNTQRCTCNPSNQSYS